MIGVPARTKKQKANAKKVASVSYRGRLNVLRWWFTRRGAHVTSYVEDQAGNTVVRFRPKYAGMPSMRLSPATLQTIEQRVVYLEGNLPVLRARTLGSLFEGRKREKRS